MLSHFPSNGGYYRVTHLNDIVPHLPSASEGFTQAGDEVWYYDEKDTSVFKICRTGAGVAETSEYSNSCNQVYGHPAHLEYLGVNLGDQCNIPA